VLWVEEGAVGVENDSLEASREQARQEGVGGGAVEDEDEEEERAWLRVPRWW